MEEIGFKLIATGGTCKFLQDSGLNVERINKVMEGHPHIVDAIINEDIDFMINTTKGPQAVADSFSIRRQALAHKIPLLHAADRRKSGCTGHSRPEKPQYGREIASSLLFRGR